MSDTTKVAQAVLREVPIGNLSSLMGKVRAADDGGNGNGCGGNCGIGNACIDRFGHSGIPQEAFAKAFRNKADLTKALHTEITATAGRL